MIQKITQLLRVTVPLLALLAFNPSLLAQCPTLVSVDGNTNVCSGADATFSFNLSGGTPAGPLSVDDGDGGGFWQIVTGPIPANADYGIGDNGNLYAMFDGNEFPGVDDATLTTPSFDLSGATSATLDFIYEFQDNAGSGEFSVQVYDGADWVEVLNQTTDIFALQTPSIDVSPYLNTNFQVLFNYSENGTFAWSMGIDDISLSVDGSSAYFVNFESSDYSSANVSSVWTDANGNEISNTSANSVNLLFDNPTGCSIVSETVSYEVFCLADGSSLGTGTLDINVHGNITSGVDFVLPSQVGSSLAITANCAGLDVQYSTDGGMTYSPNAPADVVEGEIEQVYYQVGLLDAPAGTSCFVAGNYAVANSDNEDCPVFVEMLQSDSDVCDGDVVAVMPNMVNVQVIPGLVVSVVAGDNINGPTFIRPNAGPDCVLSGQEVPYDLVTFQVPFDGDYALLTEYTTGYDGWLSLYEGSFDPDAPCENYINGDDDYLVNGVGNGGSLIIENLEAGVTYFAVVTSWSGTTAATGDYELTIATEDSNGQLVSNNFIITWELPDTTIINSDLDNFLPINHSGTTCGAEVVTANYTIACTADESFVAMGSVDVTVHPDLIEGIDFVLPEAVQDINDQGCVLAVTDLCADTDLLIEYSTDGVTYSTTTPDPLMLDDISTISYRISTAGAPEGCVSTGSYTVECTELTCPIDNTVVADIDACSHDAVNVSLDLADVVTLTGGIDAYSDFGYPWMVVSGNPIPGVAGLTGNYIVMDDDGFGNGLSGISSFEISPVPVGGQTGVTLSFDVSYNDIGNADEFYVEINDGIQTVTAYSANADINPAQNVSIDIAALGLTGNVLQTTFFYNDGNSWAWGLGIDNISVDSDAGNLYSLDFEDVEPGELPGPGELNYSIVWTNPDGSVSAPTANSSATFAFVNTDCDVQTQTLSYEVICATGAVISSQSININVAPKVLPEVSFLAPSDGGVISSDNGVDCNAGVIINCVNIDVEYATSADGPFSATVPNLALNEAEEIFYTVSSDIACGTASGSYTVICGQAANCPVFTGDEVDVTSICSGDAVTVNINVFNQDTVDVYAENFNSDEDDMDMTFNGWTTNIVAGECDWQVGVQDLDDENGALIPPGQFNCTNFAMFDGDACDDPIASEAQLISPTIDLTGYFGSDLFLEFDYNVFGGGLIVEAYDGVDWVVVLTSAIDECGAWGCAYPQANIDLANFNLTVPGSGVNGNPNFQMRFTFKQADNHYVGVDNINISAVGAPNYQVLWLRPDGTSFTNTNLTQEIPLFNFAGCDAEVQTIQYALQCDDFPAPIQGAFDITVFPEISEDVQFTVPASISCTSDLIVDPACTGLDIQYAIAGSGNFSSTPPTVPVDGSIEIDFTVSVAGAPAGALTGTDCEASGSYQVACPSSCPSLAAGEVTAENYDVCTGSDLVFDIDLDNAIPLITPFPSLSFDDGPGNGFWEISTTSVPGFGANHPGTGGFLLFDDDAAGSASSNDVVSATFGPFDVSGSTGTLTFSFDYDLNVITTEEVTVEVWDGAAWQNVLTITGDAPLANEMLDVTAYANAAMEIRITFDDNAIWSWGFGIDNVLLSDGTTDYYSENFDGTSTGDLATVIANNSIYNYEATWTDLNGNVLVQGASLEEAFNFVTASDCAVETQGVVLTVTCPGQADIVKTYTVQVFPEIDENDFTTPTEVIALDGNTCQEGVTLNDNCSGIEVLYGTSANDITSATPPTLVEDEALEIFYIVQAIGATNATDCAIYQGSYAVLCGGNPDCVSLATDVVPSTDAICSGESVSFPLNLVNVFDTPEGLGFNIDNGPANGAWEISNGSVPTGNNPGSGNFLLFDDDAAGSASSMDVASVTIETLQLAGESNITLNFDYDLQMIANEVFSVAVTSGGTTTELLSVAADAPNASATLDLTPYASDDMSVTFTYADNGTWGWGLGIDNIVIENTNTGEIFISEDFTGGFPSGPVNYEVTWSNLTTGQVYGTLSSPNPSFSLTSSACEAQVQTIQYSIACIGGMETPIVGTAEVTVYPVFEPGVQLTLPDALGFGGDCSLEITTDCDIDILYSADGITYSTTPPTDLMPTNVGSTVFYQVISEVPTPDGVVFFTYEYGDTPTEWALSNGSVPGSFLDIGQGGSNNFFLFNGNTDPAGEDVSFTINSFDLTGVANANLSFDYDFQDFAGNGDFIVEVYNGSSWVEILNLTADTPLTSSSSDVSASANDNFQVRFTYTSTAGTAWGVGVDNIVLTADGVTVYDEDFEGGLPLAVSNCSTSGSYSVFCPEPIVCPTVIAPAPFAACDGEEVTVSLELNGTSVLVPGFTYDTSTSTSNWEISNTSVPGFGANHPGTGNFILFDDDGAGPASDEDNLSFTVGAMSVAGESNVTLNFDYDANIISLEEFTVDVWDGATWQEVLSVNADAPLASASIDVTNFANNNMQVRFTYNDNGIWGWGVGVDNIQVMNNDSDAVFFFENFDGSDELPSGPITSYEIVWIGPDGSTTEPSQDLTYTFNTFNDTECTIINQEVDYILTCADPTVAPVTGSVSVNVYPPLSDDANQFVTITDTDCDLPTVVVADGCSPELFTIEPILTAETPSFPVSEGQSGSVEYTVVFNGTPCCEAVPTAYVENSTNVIDAVSFGVIDINPEDIPAGMIVDEFNWELEIVFDQQNPAAQFDVVISASEIVTTLFLNNSTGGNMGPYLLSSEFLAGFGNNSLFDNTFVIDLQDYTGGSVPATLSWNLTAQATQDLCTNTVSANYDCPSCPLPANNTFFGAAILGQCGPVTFTFPQTDVTDDRIATWNWVDEDGANYAIGDQVTIQHSGNVCNGPETYTFDVYLGCNSTLQPNYSVYGGSYIITVYPEITADMIITPDVNTCDLTIAPNVDCDDTPFQILYSVGGSDYNATVPSIEENESVVVDYLITIPGLQEDGSGCDITGSYGAICGAACPVPTITSNLNGNRCAADGLKLTASTTFFDGFDVSDVTVNWNLNGNPTGFTGTDFLTFVTAPDGCGNISETYTLEAVVTCSNGDDIIVSAGSTTIYATPQLGVDFNLPDGGCGPIDVVCEGVNILYNVNGTALPGGVEPEVGHEDEVEYLAFFAGAPTSCGYTSTYACDTLAAACPANAGMLLGGGLLCAGEEITLAAEGYNDAPGFVQAFMVTSGPDYIIQSISTETTFDLDVAATYCVHPFNYFGTNPPLIIIGQTSALDLLNSDACFDIDLNCTELVIADAITVTGTIVCNDDDSDNYYIEVMVNGGTPEVYENGGYVTNFGFAPWDAAAGAGTLSVGPVPNGTLVPLAVFSDGQLCDSETAIFNGDCGTEGKTGIEDAAGVNLVSVTNVAPIPAVETVNVEFTASLVKTVNIEIHDVKGSLIHTQTVNVNEGVNQLQLDVRDYATGVYILSMNDGISIETTKLVKE